MTQPNRKIELLEQEVGEPIIIKEGNGSTVGHFVVVNKVMKVSLNNRYVESRLSGRPRAVVELMDTFNVFTDLSEQLSKYASDNGYTLEDQ